MTQTKYSVSVSTVVVRDNSYCKTVHKLLIKAGDLVHKEQTPLRVVYAWFESEIISHALKALMSHLMGKPTMWLPNRSDTNRAVQAQKQARNLKFGFRKKRKCTICVAKTKALISFTVTTKLICVFVFAYADSWFSHEEAHFKTT